METDEDALAVWEQRLHLAEDDLRQRTTRALAENPSPDELRAFAAARDRIALDRDALADALEERAAHRDGAALHRDVAGSDRDRRARSAEQDRDAGFPDRALAGGDRDDAASDRSDSHDDRDRGRTARGLAAEDRVRAADDRDHAATRAAEREAELARLRAALETRQVIGQAQGLLMAEHGLSPEASFAVLVRLSQQTNVKLRDVAVGLVTSAGGHAE